MRRMASFALAAATAAALATGGQASAAPLCGGQLDYDCDYYSANGQRRHCLVWANYRCADPQFAVTDPGIGGPCDGNVDVNCNEYGGVRCTLYTSRTRCFIGA
jgi:hypothetical protein